MSIIFSVYFFNSYNNTSIAEFDLCDEITCQLRRVLFFEPHTPGINVFQVDLTYQIVTFERKF